MRFVGTATFDDYMQNELLRAGVERKFEIIGEATKFLSEAAPHVANRIRQRASLISFRNVLIHGYAVVDDRRVFLAAKNPLEELRQDVKALIAELEKLT